MYSRNTVSGVVLSFELSRMISLICDSVLVANCVITRMPCKANSGCHVKLIA